MYVEGHGLRWLRLRLDTHLIFQYHDMYNKVQYNQ